MFCANIISQTSENIKHLLPKISPNNFRDYDCFVSGFVDHFKDAFVLTKKATTTRKK